MSLTSLKVSKMLSSNFLAQSNSSKVLWKQKRGEIGVYLPNAETPKIFLRDKIKIWAGTIHGDFISEVTKFSKGMWHLKHVNLLFNSLPVLQRIKFSATDPYTNDGPADKIVDAIHVQPTRTLPNGDEIPARFDTALINTGDGVQIHKYLRRYSNNINGDEQYLGHIAIWPHPIEFTNGTQRLSWVKDFPYLAEYSYFADCFREKAPGRMWMGMFVTSIESWVGKKELAEWHVWAVIIISPEAPAKGKRLLIYDCDGQDVNFQQCRAREALPLSIQRDFWQQKKIPFAELWRSNYNPETISKNQCMKNTCKFLIRTVKSPPQVKAGPDGETLIDGFQRVLYL
ncbi:hypothetical protein B0H10DRAFT_1967474 [Mycena sp. CBHHK59/15]|nr:hypothetical protein B0H10DRAFT_1967474 [Mycena sp. CBHHK59/15]